MKQKNKKKMPTWARVIMIILILLICLVIGAYAFLMMKMNRMNHVDHDDVSMIDPANEDFEVDEDLLAQIEGNPDADVLDPEDVTWGSSDISVMRDKNVINILLIGQDRRPGEGRARSDTMIICSINKNTDQIILTSVMRDLYVPIPGYSPNRINAAYQFGGMPLLDQVMEESLGIHIDGNVEVDFDGFLNSLSVLGNLDLELNAAEAKYMNDASGGKWTLQEGMNSMTPEQVLAYARNRSVGNSDWRRTERQRAVVISAFSKARSLGLTKMLELADEILPNLTTDMDNNTILGYVYTVLAGGMSDVQSYRIPVDGTYTCETLRVGMEVLVPNLAQNSQYLQSYIYGK